MRPGGKGRMGLLEGNPLLLGPDDRRVKLD